MHRMIAAIDFDGTLVEHRFPRIGEDLGAALWLKKLLDMGVRLILLTMRDGDELQEAVSYMRKQGVWFWGHNENPEQEDFDWTNSRKVYAHVYVDDCGLGIPSTTDSHGRKAVDWDVAGPMLIELAKEHGHAEE